MKSKIIRTNSKNKDFVYLVSLLDTDLAIRDGKDHSFYHNFNNIESLQYVVLIYAENTPISCGAMKEKNTTSLEIKRMFTLPTHRNNGFSTLVLGELEKWAAELSYSNCILETGKKQPEAIALYKKNGYKIIDNYEPYVGIENSICFQKKMKIKNIKKL